MMRDLARIGIAALVWCVALGVALAGAPLHEAAAKGDLDEIDRLIAAGEGVDRLKFKAFSPLAYAAKKGRLDAVKHLVEVHNARVDLGGGVTTRPLYLATSNGHRQVAEYLVGRGADTESVYHYGKGKKRQAYSARLTQPNWPWERWIGELNAERERQVEAVRATLDEQRAHAQAAAEAERSAELEARWQRDARLPVDVRKDKYMLALKKKLDEADHDGALVYFEFLRRLDVPLGPTFELYHGEILLETGQTDEGLDRLYAFVQIVDAADPGYARALELINTAEGH